jgi:hypothetical protein
MAVALLRHLEKNFYNIYGMAVALLRHPEKTFYNIYGMADFTLFVGI